MLKGLLIRALTICNTQKDFFRAAVHYTQGLISRGFPISSLLKAWNKFAADKIEHVAARKSLTNQFKGWLKKLDFSHCEPDQLKVRRTGLQKLLLV
jgi:hypothetical protein